MNLLPRSIRWRIQLWHGLLLLLVLVVLGIAVYQLQSISEYRRLDAELTQRVGVLANVLGRHRGGGPPGHRGRGEHPARSHDDERPRGPRPGGFGPAPKAGSFRLPSELQALFEKESFYYAVWSRNGDLMGSSEGAPKDLERPLPGTIGASRRRAGRREQVIFTPPGECLLAGVSEEPTERSLTRLAIWLTASGAGILALGLTVGWWLTTRAIAPIKEISLAATRIAAGNLHERISQRESGSELGQLVGVLNATFAQLEESFTRQARFTSDAAHELRTPVSIVLAHAQLALSRPRDPKEYQDALVIVRRSAERMRNLVESLLQLAVLEANAEPLQLVRCDLSALAQEQVEHVSPMAAEKDITMEVHGPPAFCLGDCDRLTQIFTNLLSNALKYCRPGDAVAVTIESVDGKVLARVADTGPRVAEEHLPHVFEPFYRADASRNRDTGGAGLGLAICRTIAEAHGGTLEARANGEKGLIFTLTLPAAEQPI